MYGNTFEKMFPKPCWNVFEGKDGLYELVVYFDAYELYIDFRLVEHTKWQFANK